MGLIEEVTNCHHPSTSNQYKLTGSEVKGYLCTVALLFDYQKRALYLIEVCEYNFHHLRLFLLKGDIEFADEIVIVKDVEN